MSASARFAMSSNAVELVDGLDGIVSLQQQLSRTVLDSTKPEPGPYALFYHHGLLIQRLEDLKRIVGRIGRARQRSTELAYRADRYMPKSASASGKPYSKRLQTIAREQNELVAQMRLDVESLYIVANLTLDQWSFVIAYCLGLADPTAYRYVELVNRLQGGKTPAALLPLKQHHLADAVWLQYQVRFYRNAFIEHVERPWQRGSTMGVYGEDFNFFICTPVGWIPEARKKRMVDGIRGLAPKWIAALPADHWQSKPRAVLEAAYREIDQLPRQADREKVWKVWAQIGGSTVSFDVLGRRLVTFLKDSTRTVQDSVKRKPGQINLGPPGV